MFWSETCDTKAKAVWYFYFKRRFSRTSEYVGFQVISSDSYLANAHMHSCVSSSVNMSMYVLLSVLGYNPVITIPAGATNINVTEIRRSKNYLGEFFD